MKNFLIGIFWMLIYILFYGFILFIYYHFWISLILLGVLAVVFIFGFPIWQELYYRISKAYCHILLDRALNEKQKGNYDKALEYYNKSLRFSHTMSDDAKIHSEIGEIYLLKEKIIEYDYENKINTRRAIEHFKEVIDDYLVGWINNCDKALEYYYKCLQLINDIDDVTDVYNKNEEGYIHGIIKCFEKSIETYQKNDDYSGTAKDMINIALPYINLYDIWLDLEDNLSEAEHYLTQGLEMAKKLGDKYLEARAYEIFCQLYYSKRKPGYLVEEYFTKSYDLYKAIDNDGGAQRVLKIYLKFIRRCEEFHNFQEKLKQLEDTKKSSEDSNKT
jgi:tetratricopeptide (TPR) repeat protein